jgi:hypothetical protein
MGVTEGLPTIRQLYIASRCGCLRGNPCTLAHPCPQPSVKKAFVDLQDARPAGPPGDIALQESGEVVRARRQLFPAKADPREVHVHNRINQLAHHNFAISAGGRAC